jgi:hypothetical protein
MTGGHNKHENISKGPAGCVKSHDFAKQLTKSGT